MHTPDTHTLDKDVSPWEAIDKAHPVNPAHRRERSSVAIERIV